MVNTMTITLTGATAWQGPWPTPRRHAPRARAASPSRRETWRMRSLARLWHDGLTTAPAAWSGGSDHLEPKRKEVTG